MKNEIISILSIAAGIALILLVLGGFLIRLAIALCGVWLINYGFALRGTASLYTRVYNWRLFRRFY